MSGWTPSELQAATSGHWRVRPVNEDVGIEGVSIDSRTLVPGDGFFAVQGPRFDGHDFLAAAVAAGASMLIVDRPEKVAPDSPFIANLPKTVSVLLVDQVPRALADLTRVYRQRLKQRGVKVIAVTGSNGKTTTRHLIHSVLSASFRGVQSPASFNNHLGVPLTLLSVKDDDQFVVVEVGSNHPGEIAMLADLVRPDVAVLTNIGQAHLGQFGSRHMIAREKQALLGALCRGGIGILPGDEPLLEHVRVPGGCRLVRVGRSATCDFVLTRCAAVQDQVHFAVQYPGEQDAAGQWELHELDLTLNLPGEHNAFNAALTLPVARWMCMNLADPVFAMTLASVKPCPMRLQIQAGQGIQLINDAYNANPDSMKAALRTLQQVGADATRRVAILGDMMELGDDGQHLHAELGDFLAALTSPSIDLVILIGELTEHLANRLKQHNGPQVVHWLGKQSSETTLQITPDLNTQVARLIQPGDTVLIKGSRGMAMEQLIDPIYQHLGRREATHHG